MTGAESGNRFEWPDESFEDGTLLFWRSRALFSRVALFEVGRVIQEEITYTSFGFRP